MPRMPRHQSSPIAMRPGSVYHVTSRAVANTALFEKPRDYLTFLSQLAEQCRVRELLVHAFCCMTTHVHLQLEDRRGQISQAMSVVKSLYARYYNGTREGGRRHGALWAERFNAEGIDSKRYFDASAAYVQLNPMRTKKPMVESPERYPWSSCAMTVVDGVTPAEYFRHHVDKEGGIDAILDSMPKPSTRASGENRRRRFEILLSGREFAVEAVLGDRTRDEYLAHLLARVGVEKAELHDAREATAEELGTQAPERPAQSLRPPDSISSVSSVEVDGIPRLLEAFNGLAKNSAVDRIVCTVRDWLPAGGKNRRELRDAEIWALWRFASHSVHKIARIVRVTADEVDRAIRRVRALRLKERAWWRSIWNAEWSLRWSLAAAPWRE